MVSAASPEGVVLQLCSKFPEHKFEICKPSPFIIEILNIMDDIILCYNVQEKNNRTIPSDSTTLSTIIEGSSCGGNPMEVPSCLETSLLNLSITDNDKPVVKKTYHYFPLSSHQALRVKSFFNLKLKCMIPIVILCEGEVKLLENGGFRSVNRVLHCSSFSDALKTTAWSDYYKVESSSAEPLVHLLESHSKKVSGKIILSNRNFKAKSLLKMIEDAYDISEKCSIVSAQFEWTSLSLKPPLNHSTSSLRVDVNFSKAPTINLGLIWRQLIHIHNCLDYLEKDKKDPSTDPTLPSLSSLFKDLGIECELNEKTADMEMLKVTCEHALPSISNKENLTLIELTDIFADLNSNSDLTSALWTKLLGCDSYKLLQLCFKHFFKHVRSSARPKSIKNTTRLSQMIQAEHMALYSNFEFINPIEYLVEIGLEKLRQVFKTIFDYLKVPSSVFNMPSLPKFSEVADSDDWMKASKSWLAWLTRLYSSVHVLCSVEMALANPQFAVFFSVLCKVVSQFNSNDSCNFPKIDSFESLMENPQHTIGLEVPITLLSTSTVDTEYLDEWSLTVTSSTKTRIVESIFYRSPFCPIPYINEDNSSNGSEMINVTHLNTTFGANTTLSANMTVCLDNISGILHCVQSHKITDHFPFPKSNNLVC